MVLITVGIEPLLVMKLRANAAPGISDENWLLLRLDYRLLLRCRARDKTKVLLLNWLAFLNLPRVRIDS